MFRTVKAVIRGLVKNPVTIWLACYLRSTYLEFKNRKKSLVIGYMSRVHNCQFGEFNALYENVILTDVELGDYTYVASHTCISRTIIGKFCSIGPNVVCGLGKHPVNGFVSTHPAFFSNVWQSQITFAEEELFEEMGKIVIGHDVWLGANALILDGVTVGNGAVVGAGAVVTKNVPPYAIVAGVPAKIIRHRFSPDEIAFLQSIEWWNRDINWIRKNYRKFGSFVKFKDLIERAL